jgi:amino-acid N-acetyltransferase
MTTPRPARAQDLDAIARLLDDAALPSADLASLPIDSFIVVEQDDSLVGCVAVERCGDDALLRSLAVEDSRRGTGQGRHLVQAAEQHAIAQGVHTLFLLTTNAADFFEGRGYRRLDRGDAPEAVQATSQFGGLCPSSAVCMAKTLR